MKVKHTWTIKQDLSGLTNGALKEEDQFNMSPLTLS